MTKKPDGSGMAERELPVLAATRALIVSLLFSVKSTRGVSESDVSRPSEANVSLAHVMVVSGENDSPSLTPVGVKKFASPLYPK